eukprot:396333_1
MHGFKIITTKRTWYLSVNDSNLRDEWIQTIRNLIDNINTSNNTPNDTNNTNNITNKTITKKIQNPFKNKNLLKSKINKIKLQNTAKWNQLIIASHQPKATQETNNYTVATNEISEQSLLSKLDKENNSDSKHIIYSDRDEISHDIYSEGSHSNTQGEHINNAEMDFNNINQTDEKQTIFIQNKTSNNHLTVGEFKLYDNNDEESELGLSLSTTPIIHPPNSPNIIKNSTNTSYDEFTDFWDLGAAQNTKYIELSDDILNAIHCTKHKSSQWMSCFGSKIVCDGHDNTWKIKILRRENESNNIYNGNNIANIVIGICDANIVKNNNIKCGGFWTHPFFGYGYSGISGNKLNENKKSEIYGCKYKINDIITVNLNDNKLIFSCNDINNGIAFNVDNKRNYVLAVAFCNDRYDIQIYD